MVEQKKLTDTINRVDFLIDEIIRWILSIGQQKLSPESESDISMKEIEIELFGHSARAQIVRSKTLFENGNYFAIIVLWGNPSIDTLIFRVTPQKTLEIKSDGRYRSMERERLEDFSNFHTEVPIDHLFEKYLDVVKSIVKRFGITEAKNQDHSSYEKWYCGLPESAFRK